MSALLSQVQELLCEHWATFSYGRATHCRCSSCHTYKIAIDDQMFESDTFSEVVSKAWDYVCGEETRGN